MRETFIIKSAWKSVFDDLGDKQAGVLIKAIFSYMATGEKPTMQSDLEIKMAFKFISIDLDAFEDAYQKKCMTNRENGAKGADYGKLGGRPRKWEETPKNPQRGNENPENPLNDNDEKNISTSVEVDSVVVKNDNNLPTKKPSTSVRTPTRKATDPNPGNPTVVDLKACVVHGDAWREDIEDYRSALRQCYKALRNDTEWLAERKRLNPRVDVLLTLDKVCVDFWATEEGWARKKEAAKKAKSGTINWKTTLAKSIGQKFNHVYENGTGNNQAKRGNALTDEYLQDLGRRAGIVHKVP